MIHNLYFFVLGIYLVQCCNGHKEEIRGHNEAIFETCRNVTKDQGDDKDFLVLQRRSQQILKRVRNKQRRSVGSTNEQCASNKTAFDYELKFNCQYDKACFENFNDCCWDYEMRCGKQIKGKETANVFFTCVKMEFKYKIGCGILYAEGIWMIQMCPHNWPTDETKRKCVNPPEKFSHPVEDYLPVVSSKYGFTYRNKHCAICHGIESYTSWHIKVQSPIMPPAKYDLDAKLRFIDRNGGSMHVRPIEGQPRRYCLGENYKGGCDNGSHKNYTQCLEGPVELVLVRCSGLYYKNKACADCNRSARRCRIRMGVCGELYSQFSLLFHLRNNLPQLTKVAVHYCPHGTAYDKELQFCREAYTITVEDNLSNVFLEVFWIRELEKRSRFFGLQRHLKAALTENFHLMLYQISGIKFHRQNYRGDYYVATFHLTLTPYQNMILANQENLTDIHISNKSKTFMKLLRFTSNFSFHYKNYSFSVINMISKQLACVDGITLKYDEYHLDRKTQIVFENNTGKSFSLRDYSILKTGGGNITLCRILLPIDCTNGSYVPLRQNEYTILSNLTLYHNITKQTFAFGQYLINENVYDDNGDKPSSSNTKIHQDGVRNRFPPSNSTVLICLPYQPSYPYIRNAQQASGTLRILTITGFTISIICLLLLLFIYAMFTELRTLPGMNLMNLSFSLLLYQSLWLIRTAYSQSTWCKIFAIIEHYLILASFLAMSAISYHSCLIFSRSFGVPKKGKGPRRTFLKYSAVVWCPPAIFVSICVILDRTKTFTVNYGTQCWLGTTNAKLYLFLLPIALLLLFNIIAFVRTVIRFARHQKHSQILQNTKRQNLLICIKLSTLMGFPWIFAFFGIMFPDVVALEYFFVAFVCFQGFYIGVAFLCNRRTLNLLQNQQQQKKLERNAQHPPDLQNLKQEEHENTAQRGTELQEFKRKKHGNITQIPAGLQEI